MLIFCSSIPKRRNARDVEWLPRVSVPAGRGLHPLAVPRAGSLSAPTPAQAARARPTAAPLASTQQPARRHTELHATATGRTILYRRGETRRIHFTHWAIPSVNFFNIYDKWNQLR